MTEEAKSSDIFISYRRADADFADRLYTLLERRGVSVWYDALIQPGADWRDTIAQRLQKANLMVIVLSSEALKSKELKKELAVADLYDVPLLAVRLEEIKPRESFAYELARGNWFDIFPNPERRLSELVDYLESLSKNDSGSRKELQRSLAARRVRHFRTDSLLFLLFFAFTAIEFALYERRASPTEELIRSGLSPLMAFGYVLIATSLGSPLLLFSVLRDDLNWAAIPLLLVASANTVLILLLARSIYFHAIRFFRYIAHRTSWLE
jgi:hypothetical protein